MQYPTRSTPASRLVWCSMPVLLGISAALALLLVAGGPARPAYAATHTFPGCASTIQDCIDSASPGDTMHVQGSAAMLQEQDCAAHYN